MNKTQVLAPLLRRLNTGSGIDEADIAAIRALPITVREWEAGRAIVFDGDRTTESCLVIEGFCVRSKTMGTAGAKSSLYYRGNPRSSEPVST